MGFTYNGDIKLLFFQILQYLKRRLLKFLKTAYHYHTKMNLPLKKNLYWILGFVVLIWVIELINISTGHQLSDWGILPRTLKGLKGIPLSPFLHASLIHIMMNTIPLAVLGGFVLLNGRQMFFEVTVIIILVGGAALWLFGRSSYHVGASGLIFGYFGYLVLRAWYDRSLKSFIIAFITVVLYGGIIWGLLPVFSRISWEGHLFGLLAGFLAARLEKTKK